MARKGDVIFSPGKGPGDIVTNMITTNLYDENKKSQSFLMILSESSTFQKSNKNCAKI